MMTKKKDFWNHYFRFRELTQFGNEKVYQRLENIDSIKKWLDTNYILANIPQKYFKFELDKIKKRILTVEKNYDSIDKIDSYLNNLENAVKKGIGLYLSGPHGVAKTTISIIILKEAIKQHYKCFFCKSSEIINFARSGWKSEDRKIYWDYIVDNTDILVVDDIVRLFDVSEKERVHIDEIFTKRDDANKVTIITANHELRDNKDVFGDALYSNFKERLIEIDLIGDDYRDLLGEKLMDELLEKKGDK